MEPALWVWDPEPAAVWETASEQLVPNTDKNMAVVYSAVAGWEETAAGMVKVLVPVPLPMEPLMKKRCFEIKRRCLKINLTQSTTV